MTEAEIDAGARALYGEMKIVGVRMTPFDKLPAISRGRYQLWAGVVIEAAEQAREQARG